MDSKNYLEFTFQVKVVSVGEVWMHDASSSHNGSPYYSRISIRCGVPRSTKWCTWRQQLNIYKQDRNNLHTQLEAPKNIPKLLLAKMSAKEHLSFRTSKHQIVTRSAIYWRGESNSFGEMVDLDLLYQILKYQQVGALGWEILEDLSSGTMEVEIVPCTWGRRGISI